jgi:hypothetical protein
MKKALLSTAAIVMVAIALASIAIPVLAAGTTNPNKLYGAQTYNLNILGKKADYNGEPAYDSSRHTMLVPEDIASWETATGYTNATIWVSQTNEFAVTDPNMFDDGRCNLTLAPGKYEVYFVALGKPGSSATIEGWIYNATDNTYLMQLGSVTVSHNKQPSWQSGHSMFYVTAAEAAQLGITLPTGITEMWIFDFLTYLSETYSGTNYLYLWNLVGGLKHIQVRFYQVS